VATQEELLNEKDTEINQKTMELEQANEHSIEKFTEIECLMQKNCLLE